MICICTVGWTKKVILISNSWRWEIVTKRLGSLGVQDVSNKKRLFRENKYLFQIFWIVVFTSRGVGYFPCIVEPALGFISI